MAELNFDANQVVLNQRDEVISFKCELHGSLQQAMIKYVEQHPNLDQYSIIHRAIAGFLIEKGFYNREITKLYLGGRYFQRNPKK